MPKAVPKLCQRGTHGQKVANVAPQARRVAPGKGRLGRSHLSQESAQEREGVIVTISRRLALEPARMTEKVIVTGSRGNGEYERHQRLYTSDELSRALERMGFRCVELFGSSDCAAFERATAKTMWAFGQRGAD